MKLEPGRRATAFGLVTACAVAAFAAPGPRTPAHYLVGGVPAMPVQAGSGGQVFVVLTIDPKGAVANAQPLRVTPPFTEPMLDVVRSWQFLPAEEVNDAGVRERVTTKVLVAALFRPPALFMGTTAGVPPADVATAPPDMPFPTSEAVPPYPPNALGDGVVLIEAQVDRTGSVADAAVVHQAPPFDGPALAAARQWIFRPAQRVGQPVDALVYILFGFRQPVIGERR